MCRSYSWYIYSLNSPYAGRHFLTYPNPCSNFVSTWVMLKFVKRRCSCHLLISVSSVHQSYSWYMQPVTQNLHTHTELYLPISSTTAPKGAWVRGGVGSFLISFFPFCAFLFFCHSFPSIPFQLSMESGESLATMQFLCTTVTLPFQCAI